MSISSDLAGKVTVVTGASSGMGERIARVFGASSAVVFAVARSKEKLEGLCHEIARSGGKAYPVPLDLSQIESGPTLKERIAQEFKTLDIIVNCAAITIKREAVDLSEEEWDKVVNTNARSVFLMAKYLGPALFRKEADSDFGKFLTFGSVGTFLGIPLSSAYCASKGAVVQLAKTLAVEWAHHKVSVNAICPGYIDTPLSASALRMGQTYRKVIEKIPLRSIGNVDDVTELVLFLVSQRSNYITGATVNLDGGLLSAAYTMDL